VPLGLLADAGIHAPEVIEERSRPPILRLLGINPSERRAVRHEHTRTLPGIF